ncbi:MAG: transposase [Deltaproteobacteria bacterium]|nr:transposase [Deltaproteobacteria bacterium]
MAERVAAYVIREGVIDAEGRERLARYVSRPPFAERQARLCRDGRVAFRLGHPKPTGKTHLFLDPLTFLRRVTSQIPPLGMNLV